MKLGFKWMLQTWGLLLKMCIYTHVCTQRCIYTHTYCNTTGREPVMTWSIVKLHNTLHSGSKPEDLWLLYIHNLNCIESEKLGSKEVSQVCPWEILERYRLHLSGKYGQARNPGKEKEGSVKVNKANTGIHKVIPKESLERTAGRGEERREERSLLTSCCQWRSVSGAEPSRGVHTKLAHGNARGNSPTAGSLVP